MTMTIVLFIVGMILGFMIVNGVQRIFMKLIGADAMFFNGKKKAVASFIVGLAIFGILGAMFGLGN